MIEAVAGEAIMWALPVVFGAAILRLSDPDRITDVRTTRPSGPRPEGLAVKDRVGVDYLYIPTGAQVTADINGVKHALKIKDDDMPNNNLEIYLRGEQVVAGNQVHTTLQRIANRTNLSVLYMGPVDNIEAYAAFVAAVKRLRAADKLNHPKNRK